MRGVESILGEGSESAAKNNTIRRTHLFTLLTVPPLPVDPPGDPLDVVLRRRLQLLGQRAGPVLQLPDHPGREGVR